MEIADPQPQDIHLRAPHGPIARVIFGVIGAAIISIALYDLGRALWPVGWWSLFFAIIIYGGCWVGVKFLIAGIFGEDVRWTLGEHEMRFERQSLLRQRTDIFRAGDVAATGIKTHDWDSRPDTFSVAIRLGSGRTVETPQVGTRERAEALEAAIRSRLSVPG